MGFNPKDDEAKRKQQGSKLDQLYSDGSGSKLDQLYSSGGRKSDSERAAAAERKINTRNQKAAVTMSRSKDPREQAAGIRLVAEMQAQPGYQAQPNITRHGQYDEQDRQTARNFEQEGMRLYNNGQGKDGSSGGEWVNVGPKNSADAIAAAASDPNGNRNAPTPSTDQYGNVTAPVDSMSTNQPTTPPSTVGVEQNRPQERDYRAETREALAGLKEKFGKEDMARAEKRQLDKDLAIGVADKGVQIDPKYAVSKEQAAEMVKAGISGKADKKMSQADIELAKIKNDPKLNAGGAGPAGESAKERTARLVLQAKKNAAKKTGYKGEVTSETDFAAEAKGLIPGAKKEVQAIIDARDSAIDDKAFRGTLKSSNRQEDLKQDAFDSFAAQLGIDQGSSSDRLSVFDQYEKDTNRLKEFRGAPAFSEDQSNIVSSAPSIRGEDEPTIIPSGNPLFGDSPGAEALYKQSAQGAPKPAEKPKTNPVGKQKEDVSMYAGGSPLGGQLLDTLSVVPKIPGLVFDKIADITVPGYKTQPKPAEEIRSTNEKYYSERVADLRGRAEGIDTSSVFGKTKKANLLKAADGFEKEGLKYRDPKKEQERVAAQILKEQDKEANTRTHITSF